MVHEGGALGGLRTLHDGLQGIAVERRLLLLVQHSRDVIQVHRGTAWAAPGGRERGRLREGAGSRQRRRRVTREGRRR